MTNWYSPSIKADWEDLLKRNPDATDALNFIVSHGDVEDIIESMSDESFGELVADKMEFLVETPAKSSIIKAVGEYLNPEDIFTESELDHWAEDHGWADLGKVQRLIKAIHELDGLLESDFSAVENWRDEIVHMQDMMQELED